MADLHRRSHQTPGFHVFCQKFLDAFESSLIESAHEMRISGAVRSRPNALSQSRLWSSGVVCTQPSHISSIRFPVHYHTR